MFFLSCFSTKQFELSNKLKSLFFYFQTFVPYNVSDIFCQFISLFFRLSWSCSDWFVYIESQSQSNVCVESIAVLRVSFFHNWILTRFFFCVKKKLKNTRRRMIFRIKLCKLASVVIVGHWKEASLVGVDIHDIFCMTLFLINKVNHLKQWVPSIYESIIFFSEPSC